MLNFLAKFLRMESILMMQVCSIGILKDIQRYLPAVLGGNGSNLFEIIFNKGPN